jgi:hypothetical protein
MEFSRVVLDIFPDLIRVENLGINIWTREGDLREQLLDSPSRYWKALVFLLVIIMLLRHGNLTGCFEGVRGFDAASRRLLSFSKSRPTVHGGRNPFLTNASIW